jgi:hypothetical protein
LAIFQPKEKLSEWGPLSWLVIRLKCRSLRSTCKFFILQNWRFDEFDERVTEEVRIRALLNRKVISSGYADECFART